MLENAYIYSAQKHRPVTFATGNSTKAAFCTTAIANSPLDNNNSSDVTSNQGSLQHLIDATRKLWRIDPMIGSEDLAIRRRRAAFNSAIAEQNLSAISALLSSNVVMVTGSDSAVISGRSAQLKVWKREFASSNSVTYVRSPSSITLSKVEPIAQEIGEWEGTLSNGEQIASGHYSAKWRKIENDWTIIAEIFVTML